MRSVLGKKQCRFVTLVARQWIIETVDHVAVDFYVWWLDRSKNNHRGLEKNDEPNTEHHHVITKNIRFYKKIDQYNIVQFSVIYLELRLC